MYKVLHDGLVTCLDKRGASPCGRFAIRLGKAAKKDKQKEAEGVHSLNQI